SLARALPRRPARPELLGRVVPGALGLRDARADPALALLADVHVGRVDREGAVPAGAHLREAARRRGPRDARLLGEPDRGRGGVRADGCRRDALALLPAAADAEHPLRLRARGGGETAAADALELGQVPGRLRQHRRLPATAR